MKDGQMDGWMEDAWLGGWKRGGWVDGAVGWSDGWLMKMFVPGLTDHYGHRL